MPRFPGPYYPLSDLSCTVPSQNLYSTSCISCHAYKPIESITCHESIKLSQATQQPLTHIIFARPMGHLLLASDYLPLLNWLVPRSTNNQPTTKGYLTKAHRPFKPSRLALKLQRCRDSARRGRKRCTHYLGHCYFTSRSRVLHPKVDDEFWACIRSPTGVQGLGR